MEIQNLINAIYSNSNNNIDKDLLSKLNIGDILKAKVLEIVGNKITLEINNNFTIEANDISLINYEAGDLVEFIVNDKVDDKLFIKSNTYLSNSLDDKLLQMGIKTDENSKNLLELLYKHQVPITKENIETILSTKKYYSKLVELIKSSNLTIDSKMVNADVKEILKQHIQSTYNNFSNNSSEKVIKQNEIIPNSVDSTKIDNSKSFINDFMSNDNISLEKLVFMLKNNLSFNAKNIVLLNNIIFGEKTITNQIKNLIDILEKTDLNLDNDVLNKNSSRKNNLDKDNTHTLDTNNHIKTSTKHKLLEVLEKFDVNNIKNKDKLNSIMKELFERLETVKNDGLGKETNSIINRNIEEIKGSLDFVNKMNDNMTFIQVPLYVNNSLENLDLYIKKDFKKKKNKNVNDTKILISLNTNNLDLVQVFIEMKQRDININFKTHNEIIKNIIKSNERILSNNLKKYEFNNIIFKYNISDEKINMMNIEAKNQKAKLNTIDIRV